MQIINLYALDDWMTLPPKKAQVFKYPEENRAVRILFNLETVTSLYIETDDANAKPKLLCTVGPGVVRVDFDAVGTFGLFADEQAGEVQFQCTELLQANFEPVDESSFTEIVQRRAVDPMFEQMWYRANKNLEARFNALQSQHQQQLAAVISQVKTDDTSSETPIVASAPSGNEGNSDPGTPAAGSEAGS